MPDYFSHSIGAKVALDGCSAGVRRRIDDHTLYLLGAQGGDVFFAYKLHYLKSNLGRRLHTFDAQELFCRLCRANISYAAGFATHYALDCTLHPIIYAYEEKSKSPFAHLRFENDLGLFISRKYSIPRSILPRERILARTFAIYDSIVKVEPSVTVTGIERCLKRHFSYTRTLFKTKRQNFSTDFNYGSLSTTVDEAVALASECVTAVVSGNISSGIFNRSFLEK